MESLFDYGHQVLTALEADFDDAGLALIHDRSPERFADFHPPDTRLGYSPVNPALDPYYSDLSEKNFRWVRLCRGTQIEAVMASRWIEGRSLEAGEFEAMVRSGSLWVQGGTWHPPQVLLPPEVLGMEGNIVLCAGLWVSPSLRGQRLSSRIVQASQLSVFLDGWDPTWLVGHFLEDVQRRGLPSQAWGLEAVYPLVRDFAILPELTTKNMWLGTLSRAAFEKRLKALAMACQRREQPAA